MIESRSDDQKVTVIKSLGSADFYRHLRFAKMIIGNSSSSFVEAPYFGTPILNVGKRQDGRISDPIIHHADIEIKKIENWIDEQIKCGFEKKNCNNLFGNGNAVNSAIDLIANIDKE